MFHEQYAFYSSTSRYMQAHFEAFTHAVINAVLPGRDDPFVVELGSNDGIMLRHFKDRGMRHLGVEPSANVAEVARSQGISTISAFFDRKLADEIAAKEGECRRDLGRKRDVPHSRFARRGGGRAAPAQSGRRLHI